MKRVVAWLAITALDVLLDEIAEAVRQRCFLKVPMAIAAIRPDRIALTIAKLAIDRLMGSTRYMNPGNSVTGRKRPFAR